MRNNFFKRGGLFEDFEAAMKRACLMRSWHTGGSASVFTLRLCGLCVHVSRQCSLLGDLLAEEAAKGRIAGRSDSHDHAAHGVHATQHAAFPENIATLKRLWYPMAGTAHTVRQLEARRVCVPISRNSQHHSAAPRHPRKHTLAGLAVGAQPVPIQRCVFSTSRCALFRGQYNSAVVNAVLAEQSFPRSLAKTVVRER